MSPTVTSLIVTPGTVTLILAPGRPVPVNSLSVEATVGTPILPFGFIVVSYVGSSGFTLTITSSVLEDLACVATGCVSFPVCGCDTGNVTLTL